MKIVNLKKLLQQNFFSLVPKNGLPMVLDVQVAAALIEC